MQSQQLAYITVSTTEKLSAILGGARPTSESEVDIDESTVSGCSLNCSMMAWCQTFAIQRRPADEVEHQTCHLFNQSRQDMAANDSLSFDDDDNIDLHEPLQFAQPNNDEMG